MSILGWCGPPLGLSTVYNAFRARIERKITFFGKRMKFRCVIEREFIGWREYGMPSGWFNSSYEAEEAANRTLDEIEHGPAVRYAS